MSSPTPVQRSVAFDLAAAAAAVVLVIPLLASLFYGDLLRAFGTNPILAFAALGASIIHLSRRPSPRECAVTVALAALFFWIYQLAFGRAGHSFQVPLIAWGSFFGLASLLMLAIHAVRDAGAERARDLSDLMAGGVWIYYWTVLGLALLLTDFLIPRTFDQFLYAFDGSLGFQPSFLLGRLLYDHPFLASPVQTIYFAIALPIALLYAAQRRRGYSLGRKILPLLMATSIGGYLLYFVLPATGPVYEFAGRFPLTIPPISLHAGEILPMSQRAVRNGMPSLHFGTALMLWWNSRIWSKAGRISVWLFVAATAFATLALGQHYFIDLVVAFPMVLVFHAAGLTAVPLLARERWVPIATGVGATFAWLGFLRYGLAVCLGRPALSWTLVLLTIAGCAILERRLWRKAAPQPQLDKAA